MNFIISDVLYTLRVWNKFPAFAMIAIGTLALGIGASTAIFSIFDGAILRPLPFPEPDQLVSLEMHTERGYSKAFSYADIKDMREAVHSARLAAWLNGTANLQSITGPVQIQSPRVSANFFNVLEARPIAGRFFVPDDEKEGAARVAVLSESLWRQRFGADPTFPGRPITVDGEPYTVIGIAPREIRLPQQCNGCMWLPIQAQSTPQYTDHATAFFRIIARLAPGTPSSAASAELSTIARRIRQQTGEKGGGLGVGLTPLALSISENYRTQLYLVLAAVLLVLVVACVNVANLLLARSAARQQESAIRVALGAPKSRIMQQHLTESLLLGVAGSAIGIGVAALTLDAIQKIGQGYAGIVGSARIDARVLLFALFAALLTSLTFGGVPAWIAAKTGITQLRESSAGSGTSKRQHQLRGTLVAIESAVALVLLVSAGLLVRTVYSLETKNMGMVLEHVSAGRLTPSPTQSKDHDLIKSWYAPLLENLRQAPGVVSAGVGNFLPLQPSRISATFTVTGEQQEHLPAQIRMISPGYLVTLGVPLLRGRDFADSDTSTTPLAVIVNENLAARDFPGQDPIGKQLFFSEPAKPHLYTIIGVMRNYQQQGPQVAVDPEIALDILQMDRQNMLYEIAATQVVGIARTSVDQRQSVALIERAVHKIDGAQPIAQIEPLQSVLVDSVSTQRFALWLFSAFAILALVLAAAGVYSTLSWTVVQRTREIGLRMALGATRRGVLRLVLRRSLIWTSIGVFGGIAGSLIAGKLLATLLWGVRPSDPLTFVAAAALLVIVAALASLIPAIKASRSDPMLALRAE